MKINKENLDKTPTPILELIFLLLAILVNHRTVLFEKEVEKLKKAISKI